MDWLQEASGKRQTSTLALLSSEGGRSPVLKLLSGLSFDTWARAEVSTIIRGLLFEQKHMSAHQKAL